MINLQWLGLLQRDIKFTKISLIEPHVLVRPAVDRQTGSDSAEGRPDTNH